jgi:4-hydroxybenzoate polyprenyltransferase
MNIRNIGAYLNERFPPVNMMLFAILFLTVYSVATYFSPYAFADVTNIVLGIVACISFFFRLRVFDEVKDYKIDVINHPQRVLQSGRVTISQLILISGLLIFTEIIWSYLNGTSTIICWLIAVAYSVLMRYEFFASTFLKKRLFLYASTHMLIMPLVILWIWSAFYTAGHTHTALYFLAALSLLGGFCFEIARKIHAPAAEKATVDSYSKSLGFAPAIIAVLLFMFAGVIVQSYLLNMINARLWPYVLIALLYIVTAVVYVQCQRVKEEKKLRLAELLVSLFMLISYVSIIIEIQFS